MSYRDFSPGANDGYVKLLTGTGRPLQIITSITQAEEYQGDDLWLVKDWDEVPGETPDRVGFLQIGWGSCSGCDALEDAQDVYRRYDPAVEGDRERVVEAQLHELRTKLVNDVKWFPTLRDLLDWYEERDWRAASYIDKDAVDMFRNIIEEHLNV